MSHFSSPDAFTSVEAKYRQNLSELTLQIERIRSMRMRSLLTMALSALAGVLLLLWPLDHRAVAVLPVVYSAFELGKFRRLGNRWRDLDARRLFVENGLRRVTHTWQGQGKDGLDLRPQEAAAQELGVLGEGSLFELLCTTRTSIGAERLAGFLLGSVPLSESRARQDAVRELREREGFVRSLPKLESFAFTTAKSGSSRTCSILPPGPSAHSFPVF